MKNRPLRYLSALLLIMMANQVSISVFADEQKDYTSNGRISFVPDSNPTDPQDPDKPDPENPVQPWDPTTPDHEPQPGTSGPLSIDFASSIDFGQNKISNVDQLYYAEAQYLWNDDHTEVDINSARPLYVQVTDKRGTNTGWSLYVKEESQFKNENTLNKELTGAEITFTNGKAISSMENISMPETYDFTLTPNVGSKVMIATENSGAGTWIDRFGELEEKVVEGKNVLKDTSVSLVVPGKTPKDAVQYNTKLTWILTNTPQND